MAFRRHRTGREDYHHGNLREALIEAAMAMIAERGLAGFAVAELARAVGVSAAAPYRHFRDRTAVLAEVARRGFDQLAAELESARKSARSPVHALERCAQVHLAFAGREAAVYAAMFEASFPAGEHTELTRAREAAFAAIRRAADGACESCALPGRPPPQMVALHVWSLTHGIANLFVSHAGDSRSLLPMPPNELLEAGLMVYLQALGMQAASI